MTPLLRIAFVSVLVSLTLGCGVLLPDRIHWTVEPDPAPAERCGSDEEAPIAEILGVALSGGGSRAAVYGAAGLEALWEHGLVDRISHLSSVSGGSIAAAYFATQRPDCGGAGTATEQDDCWREFFTGFKRAMRYDFAWASEVQQFLYPNRWLSHTRRAISFQEVLDREFLDGATFGDLPRPGSDSSARGAPILLVNGASYDEARRFVFSNLCLGSEPGATRSASFSRPGCARRVPSDFPISLAVAVSAAFPGLFGPVAFEVPPSCGVPDPEWWHLGDGGMIDNSGVDTLEEVLLEASESASGRPATALLLTFDAGKRARTSRLKKQVNYGLLSNDPSRIVDVSQARGLAYHALAWKQLRLALAERGVRADSILLRYMAADLDRWPSSCAWEAMDSGSEDAADVEAVRDRLEEVPTLLSIDECGADLMERAAHRVVHAALRGEAGERLRALGIPFREVSDH